MNTEEVRSPISRSEAKRLMAEAIDHKLFWLADRGERLIPHSMSALKAFANGPENSIRLILNMRGELRDCQRCVNLALVTREDGAYHWLIRADCAMLATSQERSDEALREWGAAQALVAAAMRAANAMPPLILADAMLSTEHV